MFMNPEKHTFTTRKGKKKQATLRQVLGMRAMWSDESIRRAQQLELESLQGKHEGKIAGLGAHRKALMNPLRLARTNPGIRLARTNGGIRLARTNPMMSMMMGKSAKKLVRMNPMMSMMMGKSAKKLVRFNPNGAGKTVEARYAGKCKMTGEEYPPGSEITKVDGVGWCLTKNL